jgi:GNAT superfamily N-acetyltransferase
MTAKKSLLNSNSFKDESQTMTQPLAATLSHRIGFEAVTVADFDELATLRIAAMQASLERVGRFDPQRARERLRNSFYPEHTAFVVLDGLRIGFYTFRVAADGLHLDHLYIHPNSQSTGVGSYVLQQLLAQADAKQLPVHLGALRDSPANRFYQRHGLCRRRKMNGIFIMCGRLLAIANDKFGPRVA